MTEDHSEWQRGTRNDSLVILNNPQAVILNEVKDLGQNNGRM